MKLRDHDLEYLRTLHTFRSGAPTTRRLASLNRWGWFALVCMFVSGLLLKFADRYIEARWLIEFGCGIQGAALGATVFIIKNYRETIKLWEVMHEIIDWKKVAELARSDKGDLPDPTEKSI